MDAVLWSELLRKPRVIQKNLGNKQRALFMDTCSSHIMNHSVDLVLHRIDTNLYKLPAKAIDLVQPVNSFVIQKIEDVWQLKWDIYKLDCVKKGSWKFGGMCKGSGRLLNPCKQIRLAAGAVREVYSMNGSNGIFYARKAMKITGMSVRYNKVLSEARLMQDLQEINTKYRSHFVGKPVTAEDVETESQLENWK